MVVDGPQVRSLLLGENGAATGAAAGTLFVDCSTIGAVATREIGAELSALGRDLTLIDAPVTGSAPRALDGTLTFMVGAGEEQFARIHPLLEAMGKVIVHAGPLGHGQIVKLINNAVAATNAAVLGEALLVGAGAGVDLEALVTVMRTGSGGSVMVDLKAAPMLAHDYSVLFKLDHMIKDLRLCLAEADRAGVPFEAAQRTTEILESASGMGFGEAYFAALIEALEAGSGTRL